MQKIPISVLFCLRGQSVLLGFILSSSHFFFFFISLLIPRKSLPKNGMDISGKVDMRNGQNKELG
jgi:hypothetical protein